MTELKTGLKKTLEVMNKRSQNFYAECVFKAMAAKVKGKGTFENGGRTVGEIISKWGAVSDDSFNITSYHESNLL